MNNKGIITTIIVIVVIVLAVVFYNNQNSKTVPTPTSTPTPTTKPVSTKPIVKPSTSATSTIHEVTYADDGFSPSTITIKVGETVRFINESSEPMWIGSNEHPTHTEYSGSTLQNHCPDLKNDSFDQCSRGDEYSFTFKKVGSWDYHNHANANKGGTVVVQ